jgi:hypothetical protein
MSLERELSQLRAPDERAAQQRAWSVLRAAPRGRTPVNRRRSSRLVALPPAVIAVVAVIAALALTPAGASVSRLIGRALGVPHAVRALVPLPARGRLLVSAPAGTWTVSADGSQRRLGPWREASWSPHGLYIAVATRDEIAAVNPHGAIQWALTRQAVSDPRRYPPTGFRVAYLSGNTLRVVAGDGSDDRLLATGVAAVAPAWRPDQPYQLPASWSSPNAAPASSPGREERSSASPPAPVRSWTDRSHQTDTRSPWCAAAAPPESRSLASAPRAPASQPCFQDLACSRSCGCPTAAGWRSAGRLPTSGRSSRSRANRGSRPPPGSRSSSTTAPAQLASRDWTAGAAPFAAQRADLSSPRASPAPIPSRRTRQVDEPSTRSWVNSVRASVFGLGRCSRSGVALMSLVPFPCTVGSRSALIH